MAQNPLHLTPSQLEAVTTVDGPLLIIAGPGSGKTLTLVERIIYLISEKNIEAKHIFVSTFTEKAARELITRVSNRLLESDIRVNLNEMYIGTLHSIFLRILEENREFTRLAKNYRMMDQFDQQYLLYNNLPLFEQVENAKLILGEKAGGRWEKAEMLQKRLNIISEELIDPELLIASNREEMHALGEFYRIYQQLLEDENALDFSFIQVETYRLLENHPSVRERLRNQLFYLMIDEYQDTNTIQEKILFQLTDPLLNNFCVVGDDDQGLYRFRGASIRNILEFPKKFAEGECKTISLVTNFRSHPDIIDFYNHWMGEYEWTLDGKSFRYLKTISSTIKEFPIVSSVLKVSETGDDNWHQEVYDFIITLRDEEILSDYNQIAFLFRSVRHPKAVALAKFLESKGINIFSPRSNLFFEREEIRLIIGAFVYVFPNLFQILKWNDSADLEVWHFYHDCANLFADKIKENIKENKPCLVWCNALVRKHAAFPRTTDYSFSTLFYQLLKFPLISKYLEVELSGNVSNQRTAYNLALFSQLLVKYEYLNNIFVFTAQNIEKALRGFFNHFLRFLYDGGMEEYEDFDEYAPSGCVSFMTIHQSKGLEFPVVIVDSLHSVPRKQYDDIDEILQSEFYHRPPFEPLERTKYFDFYRLYYTAFSRAQNLLLLSGSENPNGKGQARLPSRYFAPTYNVLPTWRAVIPDLASINLEKIKPINIKKQYSFTSDILLFENCPLQYKFFKELEFSPVRMNATLFGQLVHETIEDIHKTILRGEPELVTEDNVVSWFNRNYQSLSKSLHLYLAEVPRQSALRQVLRYREKNENEWDRVRDAEVDVSLVKDDYILLGKIDLLKGKDGTVEIVDFKTEQKLDVNSPDDREKLLRYRRQLETYAHIVENRLNLDVSMMHLYYTSEEDGNPYISFAKNDQNINDTIQSFDHVINKIENREYDMSHIDKCHKLCGGCDMRFYCQVY